jgi:hypothetical protein
VGGHVGNDNPAGLAGRWVRAEGRIWYTYITP